MAAGDDWTRGEVEATVSAYLAMMRLELVGERPSRKQFWAPLTAQLDSRSRGSVEYKFGNISAALCALGLPYSDGYQPYGNRQAIVDEIVQASIARDPELVRLIEQFAERRVGEHLPPLPSSPSEAEVEIPRRLDLVVGRVREPSAQYLPRHVDFADLEARNRELGLLGEKWVVELERHRLSALGASNLAKQVEHSSQVRGDGCGYDVLSFEQDGSPLHVEVKTTRSGRSTPFMVTARERSFSRDFAPSYRLYRVFTFDANPRLFKLRGDLAESCRELVPQLWRAWP